MKITLFAILLLTAATASISSISSKNYDTRKVSSSGAQRIDPEGTIDGSKTPEMVPDKVAYSILFRFLASHRGEAEMGRARDYLKQKLGCGDCTDDDERTQSTNAIITALTEVAEQFHQRVSVLDRQVKEIKDRHWPNPSSATMTQLTLLQSQKESIVVEIVATLPGRVGGENFARVEALINEKIKRRVKIVPPVQSQPGGPGWQHVSSHH